MKHYFPGKQQVIQEMEGLVIESNHVKSGAVTFNKGKITPDGVVKAEFIRLAKELRGALRNGRLDSLVGCEPHAVDKAFMSRVLQCSEPEQLNDKLRKLCENNGLLHAVVRHTKTLQQLLLALYPDDKKRLIAVRDNCRRHETLLPLATEPPESLKVILSLYPENERLAAVMEKNSFGQTVLLITTPTPDSLKIILSLLPENDRLAAVMEKDDFGNKALHYVAKAPESLKAVLSLYPENERLAAVKEKDNSGKTVLHWAAKTPESLKVALSLYPESERLAAVKEKDGPGNTVLHYAARNPDSLKVALSLYPENERLAAVKEENGFGETVLRLVTRTSGAPKELLSLLPEHHRFEILRERVGDIPLAEWLIGADLLLEDSFTQDYLLIYKLLTPKRGRVGFFSNTTVPTWTQAQSFDEVKQGVINFLSHPEHSQSTLAQQLLNELLTGEDKTVEALCAKWKTPPINQFTLIDVQQYHRFSYPYNSFE